MDVIAASKYVFFRFALPGFALSVIAVDILAAATLDEQINDVKSHFTSLQNARADFQRALDLGELSTTEQSDYAAWVHELSDQLMHDCKALIKTNQAVLPDDLPCNRVLTTGIMPASIDLASEHTEAEQTDGLVDELNATLGEFDERLLQEQARVKARTPHTESTSNQSSGGGSEGGSAASQNMDTETAEGDTTNGEQGEIPNERETSQTARSQTNGTGQPPSGKKGSPGKTTPGAQSNTPEGIPDGSDDDVVARQLREAAEKETDPELKKKLWEEYRRYKEGIR